MIHERAPGSVFVGRQREMETLAAALKDAISGQGRLVMLAGEPGIGKTRTAQELASLAEDQGAKVLWGWCYEEEGAPPYWPWVQAIRSYIQDCDAGQLETEMGRGAADIADSARDSLQDNGPHAAARSRTRGGPISPFRLHHHVSKKRCPDPASDAGARRPALGGPVIPAASGVHS